MPPSPHSGDSSDSSLFADFLAELLTEHGLRQSQVAKALKEVHQRASKEEKELFHSVSWSTLSRTLNKRLVHPPSRPKFNTIALAYLYAAREATGGVGPFPELRDADMLWSQWQAYRRKSLPVGFQDYSETHQSPPAEAEEVGPVKSAPASAEQLRYANAYGKVGTALLKAARSNTPSAEAALALALLRILDGHHREGREWLQEAAALGSSSAENLLQIKAVQEQRLTAAQEAPALAASFSTAAADSETYVLILERAARSGSKEAARQMAAYYIGAGEAGHAARWRAAAIEAERQQQ